MAADNVIDSLLLEIASDVGGADASIERMSNALEKLASSVNMIDIRKLTNLSSTFTKLSGSATELQNTMKGIDLSSQAGGKNTISSELGNLKATVSEVTSAVKEKTKAFQQEGSVVSASVKNEITSLTSMESTIQRITSMLSGMSAQGANATNGISSAAGMQEIGQTSAGIQQLASNLAMLNGIQFDDTGIRNIATAIGTLGRKTVTQAAANIPALIAPIKNLSSELKGLDFSGFDVQGLTELANGISKLGTVTATRAASGNITSLAKALKEMLTTLSTAPKVSKNVLEMTQALANLANAGNKAGNSSRNLSKGLLSLPSASSKAKKSFSGLAGAIGKFYATYWMLLRALQGFKKAVDISSDLTEVQNVVDNAFGDYASKVDELTQHSIQDFGMSELTAKQISGRFQAMGMAMGFAQGKMSDMSIELTKLAADMASFYNVSQKEVARSLQAVFSGETEPLRKYGLDLTQTTLKEYALKNGLDANISSMTQAQKTMLRYQYVMANTAIAQGDFARTSGTWANQTRILVQQFQQLGGIVGGVLVNAFKPFITALNSVMKSVIAFAKTVANALGAIFGWTIEIDAGGLANDFDAAGAGAEDMADGTGKAADNAKKLNRYIAAWHEVNNMTSDDGSGSGGKGGGGGAGGGNANGADAKLVRRDSILEKYKSEIDSLYELGKYIGTTLTNAMNGIDWDSVYQTAENFGKGLANFLNGLISPDLFGALGRTIAGALNTALHFLDSFGTTFDWKNFGASIAAGVNQFFSTFDFGLLGHTISTWALGLLTAINEALSKIKWEMIGQQIGKFLNSIDYAKILASVGKAIWNGINAAFNLYKGTFETAPLQTALLTLVGVTAMLKTGNIQKFANALGNSVGKAKLFITALGGSTDAIVALKEAAPKAEKVVVLLRTAFTTFRDSVQSGNWLGALPTTLQEIGSQLSTFAQYALGIGAVAGEFFTLYNAAENLATGTGNLTTNIMAIITAAGLASAALYTAFGPAGLAVAAITGIVSLWSGFLKGLSETPELDEWVNNFDSRQKDINQRIEDLRDSTQKMKDDFGTAGEAQAKMAEDMADKYEALHSKANPTAEDISLMKQYSKDLVQMYPELEQYFNGETGLLEVNRDELQKTIDKQKELAQAKAAMSSLEDAYEKQIKGEKAVADAVDAQTEARKKLLESQKKIDEYKKKSEAGRIGGEGSMTTTYDPFGVEWRKIDAEYQAANDAFNQATETLGNTRQALSDVNGDIEYFSTAYQNAATGVATNNQTIQTGIEGLKTEFQNLGITITDDFAQKIATSDSISVTAIEGMFSKMMEQTQLSAEELKTLFGQIAPQMTDEFIGVLANKSPEVQLSVTTLLANISSGVQATQPQLESLFKSLGITLPSDLITNLASQNAGVQSTVIGLLTEVNNGVQLKQPELINLFNGLGLDVPDELIKAIAGKESETQTTAINLLQQIDKAEASERGPLVNKLKQLGLDVDQNLIEGIKDTGLTQQLSDASKALPKTVHDSANAAKDEPGNSLLEVGQNMLQGFIRGLGDSDLLGGIAAAGRSLVAKLTTSVKDAGDVHSPSRVMKQIGAYFVEGFNLGITDNADSTYDAVKGWAKGINKNFALQTPTVNFDLPKKPNLKSASLDMDALSLNMQGEMDVKMAEYMYQMRQLQSTISEQNQILEEMNSKGLVFDDNAFQRKYKKAATSYRKRTGKQLGVSF